LENKGIVKILKRLVDLMELHEENPFKIRSFSNAVFKLERLELPVSGLSGEEIEKLDGIGKSIAAVLAEILESGTASVLENLLEQTPPGVIEMLDIKGIGPKKIKLLWKEIGIESLDELLAACETGKVAAIKGFGEKTQANIKDAILYMNQMRGQIHYADAELFAEKIALFIKSIQPEKWEFTGEYRRKMETISTISLLVAGQKPYDLEDQLADWEEIEWDFAESGPLKLRGKFKGGHPKLEVRICNGNEFGSLLFNLSGSDKHLAYTLEDGRTLMQLAQSEQFAEEEAIYEKASLPFIPAELREGLAEFAYFEQKHVPDLLLESDLKGSIHNHSTYSDGKHSLKEMAMYCKQIGLTYLGISDHSRTAFYANGLEIEKVRLQHKEIDELNAQLKPFKIFKGIESDILNDGSLDYPEEVLAEFDFIVASIHSNLTMDKVKATERLIKAISNPYTTMLGHPTGRLLLRREAYPIDHKAIIEACAHYGVIIEINANPWRLDLDWRWIPYALEKGVKISINPDAHEKEGFHDMKYGVFAGRKGGLTKQMTFNALGVDEVENYFKQRKEQIKEGRQHGK
jgi:DNA polymerase (family 10)